MNSEMHEILKKDPEIWDLFCRKEEYHSSIRDKFDRFPYYASKNRHIFEPTASEFLMKNGYRIEYPENKPFAVCLTHDIDRVYQSITVKGISAMKNFTRGRFNDSLNAIRDIRSKKIPYVNFEEIMKLEERYNACSSFYFLALDPFDRDYSYRIEDLEHELGTIQDRGWEVGLHVGHQGSHDLNKLMTEKKNLEKVTSGSIIGCRNHYLKFTVPSTWELLSKAGFEYDSSFGYADCAGFRNGMCYPFKPYNLRNEKIVEIIEIPQVIMDGTLFDNYMRLDTNSAWEITRKLINNVEQCHGVITVIWHNHSFSDEKRKFYEKILKYCAEKNAWMTSGEHISTWWKHSIRH